KSRRLRAKSAGLVHQRVYRPRSFRTGRSSALVLRPLVLDHRRVSAIVRVRRPVHGPPRRNIRSAIELASAETPPSIAICIPWREWAVAPMLERPWIIQVDPKKADYIIETERWRCAEKLDVVLIYEVRRMDRTFAWTYARR